MAFKNHNNNTGFSAPRTQRGLSKRFGGKINEIRLKNESFPKIKKNINSLNCRQYFIYFILPIKKEFIFKRNEKKKKVEAFIYNAKRSETLCKTESGVIKIFFFPFYYNNIFMICLRRNISK